MDKAIKTKGLYSITYYILHNGYNKERKDIKNLKGVQEITLGIIYDDATPLQHTYSLHTVELGASIPEVTGVVLGDVNTIELIEFIHHSINNDKMFVTILTMSRGGIENNE